MFRHIVPRSVKLIESKETWSIRTYRQKQGVSKTFLGDTISSTSQTNDPPQTKPKHHYSPEIYSPTFCLAEQAQTRTCGRLPCLKNTQKSHLRQTPLIRNEKIALFQSFFLLDF